MNKTQLTIALAALAAAGAGLRLYLTGGDAQGAPVLAAEEAPAAQEPALGLEQPAPAVERTSLAAPTPESEPQEEEPAVDSPFDREADEALFSKKYAYLRYTPDKFGELKRLLHEQRELLVEDVERTAWDHCQAGEYDAFPYNYYPSQEAIPWDRDPKIPADLRRGVFTARIEDDFLLRSWFSFPDQAEHRVVTLRPEEHVDLYMRSRELSWIVEKIDFTHPWWASE